jgi:hypothetical protein
MVNLFLFFLGLLVLIGVFCDNVIFLNAQKKLLNQIFEKWWNTVKNYSKVKLALVLATKINEILDSTFGPSHLSNKLVVRCSIISTGLLLITISVLGLTNHQPFGTTPWKSYSESINYLLNTTESLASSSNYTHFRVLNLTQTAQQVNTSSNMVFVNANSNTMLVTLTTNGTYNVEKIDLIGHGSFSVYYDRLWHGDERSNNQTTNSSGKVVESTNTLESLVNDIKTFHNSIGKYNTKSCLITYSIGFYIVLFTTNIFLFIVSLAFCRTILREVAKSGRVITTFSLVFTNFVFVFSGSAILLLFLTILAIPLFWILIPYLYHISADSIFTVVVFLASAAFALLVTIGGSTKLVIFIALLPSLFAFIVGVFSLLAIKWRNGFHFIVKHLFIRLIEKSPFVVLTGIIVFVTGLIQCAAKFIHFLGFL